MILCLKKIGKHSDPGRVAQDFNASQLKPLSTIMQKSVQTKKPRVLQLQGFYFIYDISGDLNLSLNLSLNFSLNLSLNLNLS